MSRMDSFLAWLKGEGGDAGDAEAATQPGAASADSRADADLRAELQASRDREAQANQRMAELQESSFKAAAETFAASVRDRITPAVEQSLVADLIQAHRDDTANPLPQGTRSRVASLQATFSDLPKHGFVGEAVQDGKFLALSEPKTPESSGDQAVIDTQGIYDARRKQMAQGGID